VLWCSSKIWQVVLGAAFSKLERLRKEIGGPDDMFQRWLPYLKDEIDFNLR
jgi:hypothetical protein